MTAFVQAVSWSAGGVEEGCKGRDSGFISPEGIKARDQHTLAHEFQGKLSVYLILITDCLSFLSF